MWCRGVLGVVLPPKRLSVQACVGGLAGVDTVLTLVSVGPGAQLVTSSL